jgi:Flp pilus assembly protein TadG
MRRRLRAFGADRRAAALVEAALIFPILLTLLLGTFEVSAFVRANGRLTDAASAIADLIAQQTNGLTSGTSGVLGSFCKAAKFVMTPFSAAAASGQPGAFSAAMASVTNQSGTVLVDWESDASCSVSATALGASAKTLATSSVNQVPNAGDSIIVIKVTYIYSGLLQVILPGNFVLSQVAFARPRGNATISCTSPCS